ncbi:MAG: cytidylate kinase family protein [Deltaproteobacteria bacterium]|nr:cytidylate kinase family protein [Deltaproteobacteria bacterium]MBW2308678.1 cytidylate kinase family protein [Deltaproteobacteria bacterium]
MSIITLSRQRGAGDEEIVEMICQNLGFISVDKQKIGDVVAGYGFQFSSLEKYDEKKPSFWDFITRERYKFIHAIQIAICELALNGNVIIIGRGGFVLLKEIPGVLRVKIIAPFELRVRNMARTGKSPEEIQHILRIFDKEGEGFLRHHYNADWNDPLLYDMVINTEKVPCEKAAKLITNARMVMDENVNEAEAQEKLADLALKLKVELAVMQDVKVDIRNLDVVVRQGNVVISGIVSHEQVKKACEEAALRVEGVKHLENRISIASILPHPYEW